MYIFQGPFGYAKMIGLSLKMLKAIFARLGYTIQYLLTNQSPALIEVYQHWTCSHPPVYVVKCDIICVSLSHQLYDRVLILVVHHTQPDSSLWPLDFGGVEHTVEWRRLTHIDDDWCSVGLALSLWKLWWEQLLWLVHIQFSNFINTLSQQTIIPYWLAVPIT